MVKTDDTCIDLLAERINKAGGVIEAIDGIVTWEEMYDKARRMGEHINEKDQNNKNDIPKNLVAEIEKARGNRSNNESRLEGKVAEVEKGLKKLMEAGKKPSHAIIEDDKFEIFGKNNVDDDERDR